MTGGERSGSEDLELPYLLGNRYEMPDPPGEGPAVVGWDRLTEREVRLRSLKVEDAETRRRYGREGKVFVRIDHPSVMQIHDVVVSEEEAPWIVVSLEPETGATLREVLASEGRLRIRRATRIAADLAWGLSLLHRERIAYGDLDPERVRLVTEGTDRETARLAELDRIRGRGSGVSYRGRALPGDPRYLAPEQLRGEPSTRASDLFALGCILFEMLAGASPIAGESVEQTVERGLQCDAPQLSPRRFGVPRSLKAILRDLLRQNPDQRPSLTATLASRLEATHHRLALQPWY